MDIRRSSAMLSCFPETTTATTTIITIIKIATITRAAEQIRLHTKDVSVKMNSGVQQKIFQG